MTPFRTPPLAPVKLDRPLADLVLRCLNDVPMTHALRQQAAVAREGLRAAIETSEATTGPNAMIEKATEGAPTSTTTMSLYDLRCWIASIVYVIRKQLGSRAAVILSAGFPIDGDHDRFAASVTGPCLTSRGLLAWTKRSVESQIDEQDSSIDEEGRPKKGSARDEVEE